MVAHSSGENQLDIALWCKNQIEHSIWDESLLFCNCACSLEYSSSSTLAGLSYHICGKLEVGFKAPPSYQHQHHALRINIIIIIFVIYAQEISQLFFQFLFCVCSSRLFTHSQVEIILLLWKFLWDFWHTRVITYDLSSTNFMHPFLKTNETSHMLITSQKMGSSCERIK